MGFSEMAAERISLLGGGQSDRHLDGQFGVFGVVGSELLLDAPDNDARGVCVDTRQEHGEFIASKA